MTAPSPARPLRVAMVVPPWYELPPPAYGGLEQVCSALVDGLVDLGHEVTLFGTGTWTGTAARFVTTTEHLQAERLGESLPELAHLARTNRLISPDRFDIVHDHTTIGPLMATRRAVPTVATVHGNPSGELGDILLDVDPSVALIAISAAQRRLNPRVRWSGVVHNGICATGLPRKTAAADGPVLWLARFSADKGPDLAIKACRAAGLPLVLAGKCSEAVEQRYLREVIEPMLGPDVRLLTNPDRATCLDLLLGARCLVMPIRWAEPFGMVMVEAMATGTPVVALDRGAVAEIVRAGETGLVCGDPAELPAALLAVAAIDPAACVEHVRAEFSAERIARGYVDAYRSHLAARAGVAVTPVGVVPAGVRSR